MAADQSPDDLRAAVRGATDGLYGEDPAQFVPARDELVRRLRKAGNRSLAAEVAKLRRPNPAAWAVNQLARRRRADLETLVALGEELRSAQASALAGQDAATLRAAGRARREAVTNLTDVALGLLAERGPGGEAHQGAIAATLQAASLDPESAAAVLSGRLTSPLAPVTGFGEAALGEVDAGFIEVETPGPEAAPGAEAEAEAEEESPELARAERALAEAVRRSAESGEAASAASARATRLRQAVAEAEAHVASLERQLDEARRRLRDAERDAAAAEDAAAEAEAAATEAARRVREAEQQAAEATGRR